MRRITEPLRAMGAHIEEEQGDALPLTIRGGRLHALTYTSPVASAQVKSALLFAGLTGNVAVTIREPYRSRDHTERLLMHLGLNLRYENGAISFRPSAVNVPSFHFSVPGDASSAAFLIAANLRAVGVESETRGNDLFVRGTTEPPRGRIETARDHRLAMAFAVLGTTPGADVRLSERASVSISYPRFFSDLRRIGAGGRGKGRT